MTIPTASKEKKGIPFNIINSFIRFHCHVNKKAKRNLSKRKKGEEKKLLVDDHKSIP